MSYFRGRPPKRDKDKVHRRRKATVKGSGSRNPGSAKLTTLKTATISFGSATVESKARSSGVFLANGSTAARKWRTARGKTPKLSTQLSQTSVASEKGTEVKESTSLSAPKPKTSDETFVATSHLRFTGDCPALLSTSAVTTATTAPRTHRKRSEPLPSSSFTAAIRPLSSSRPKVLRSEKQRGQNPERLNLEKRGLRFIPVLQTEGARLRLLNCENNRIAAISNLRYLPNLIFLDLYNNEIEHISGLSSVPQLRVLMLGRNRIAAIGPKDLGSLRQLDVLDLHCNQLTAIAHIGHLTQLRVLNAAGNQLTEVSGLQSLTALVELNLRRNCIERLLHSFEEHSSLQRVLLSNNRIDSVHAIEPLAKAPALLQLAIANNPFTAGMSPQTMSDATIGRSDAHPMDAVIAMFPVLTQLDSENITLLRRANAEQKFSTTVAKQLICSEELATDVSAVEPMEDWSDAKLISDTRIGFDKTLHTSKTSSQRSVESAVESSVAKSETSKSEASDSALQSVRSSAESELIGTIMAEWRRNGRCRNYHSELSAAQTTLACFGCTVPMEFRSAFRKLSDIHICCVEFDSQIAPNLKHFPAATPALRRLRFDWNNINRLSQIDALCVLPQNGLHLSRVDFGLKKRSNSLVESVSAHYRDYCKWKLPSLQSVDGFHVCEPTLFDRVPHKVAVSDSESIGGQTTGDLHAAVADLCEQMQESEKQTEDSEAANRWVVDAILQRSEAVVEMKRRLARVWPEIVRDLMRDALSELHSVRKDFTEDS